MDLKERREFYEKVYFHEIDMREKIESRLKLPMTIFAIVFTMALFLFNKIVVDKAFSPDGFFLFLYVSGCVLLGFSIYYFIKSWYGYHYKMIPNAIDIENYYLKIKSHYECVDAESSNEWTHEAFQEYLLSSFRDYSAYNTVNNDRKSYNLHRCISSLLISFLLLVMSYYPYYSFIHLQS